MDRLNILKTYTKTATYCQILLLTFTVLQIKYLFIKENCFSLLGIYLINLVLDL